MAKYLISCTMSAVETVEVDADNPHVAVESALATLGSEWRPESISLDDAGAEWDELIVGRCDKCGTHVFGDEQHAEDDHGVWHAACYPGEK